MLSRKSNKKVNFGQINDQFKPYFKKSSNRRRRTQKRWTVEENLFYSSFIKNNRDLFQSQTSRRCSKVFKLIENQIKSKTSFQCKSHHQKMIKKYQTIQQIIRMSEQKGSETSGSQALDCSGEDMSLDSVENVLEIQEQGSIIFRKSEKTEEDNLFDVLYLQLTELEKQQEPLQQV